LLEALRSLTSIDTFTYTSFHINVLRQCARCILRKVQNIVEWVAAVLYRFSQLQIMLQNYRGCFNHLRIFSLLLLCAICMIEIASLRIIPINISGIVPHNRLHEHDASKPWALPHEVPGHLWSNYGEGDYELHVARRFLVRISENKLTTQYALPSS